MALHSEVLKKSQTDTVEFLSHTCLADLPIRQTPRWTKAVQLFNDRFENMPFTLSVANQTQAALGKEKARLKFTFTDSTDTVEWSRSEIRTLSQGEKRALYLLNFIFEVEARKLINQETLFIIDDVADSFDYKNKHAIVQYLKDLSNTPNFHQIILTHNFDFFRTLVNSFVSYDRCFMTKRSSNAINRYFDCRNMNIKNRHRSKNMEQ